MELFVIVAAALFTYPIAALVWYDVARSKPALRKKAWLTLLGLNFVVLLGWLLGISTISDVIDGSLTTTFYLTLSLTLVTAWHFKHLLVKILTGTAMFFVFGLGYLLCTIGILGLAFGIGGMESDRDIKLSNDITYKQYSLGNATSDYRGVKVAVFRSYTLLPGFERQIFSRDYELIFYSEAKHWTPFSNKNDPKVIYIASKKQVILQDSIKQQIIQLP